MLNNPKSKAYHLLEEIKKFEGDKIVTVCCGENAIPFDISEDGKVGYIPRHLDMCLNMIENGLKTSGSIVIRQFTNMSMEVVTPKGKMSILLKSCTEYSCMTTNIPVYPKMLSANPFRRQRTGSSARKCTATVT